MSAHPLVSVLIPLYNHARYVERCLDSLLEDGHPRLEVLIIDDGSRDDSALLARQWYERHSCPAIERFELESRPNRGVTRTFNELVAKAKGDFVVLLASDDHLLPDGIAARLGYLAAHPEKLAVFGDCIVIDGAGSKTHDSGVADLCGGRLPCLVRDDLLALELIFNWCVPGPGFMARRELYDRIGLYDETLLVEDWDMYLRIAARGALGFLPSPVAAYRYHQGNSVVNPALRQGQLDSLMRTAWKNQRNFKGIKRLGLLHKFYMLKHDRAVALRRARMARFYWKISRLLQRFAVRRYEEIVASLAAG